MPSYPEGTRQWAEQRLAALKAEIEAHFEDWEDRLTGQAWWHLSVEKAFGVCDCDCPQCDGEREEYREPAIAEKLELLRLEAEAIGQTTFPEAYEPIYSSSELEAAGQGVLL